MSAILTWLAGGALKQILGELRSAHEARLRAKNDAERIAADLRIQELEAQKEILIAEQGKWYTAWVRPLIALPFALFIWKVVVWDTVLGLGTTPHLSTEMYQMMTVVIGAYFIGRAFEKWGRG